MEIVSTRLLFHPHSIISNVFRPSWREPVQAKILDNTLYSVPAPVSGPVLIFILNLLTGLLDTTDTNLTSPHNWQRIVESMKHGFGRRTQLGDPDKIDIQEVIFSNIIVNGT